MSVTVITDQENAPPQVLAENSDGSPVELVPAETVEEISDASVEIAQIEADAQVAIAETHAAVELARIEAVTDQERLEWQNRLASMEAEKLALQEQVSTLQTHVSELTALTTIAVTEVTPSEEPSLETIETIPEEEISSLIQSDTLEETSLTQTGPIAVSESAEEVAVSVPLVSVRKPIFKLV